MKGIFSSKFVIKMRIVRSVTNETCNVWFDHRYVYF